jgi:hypothetical protein
VVAHRRGPGVRCGRQAVDGWQRQQQRRGTSHNGCGGRCFLCWTSQVRVWRTTAPRSSGGHSQALGCGKAMDGEKNRSRQERQQEEGVPRRRRAQTGRAGFESPEIMPAGPHPDDGERRARGEAAGRPINSSHSAQALMMKPLLQRYDQTHPAIRPSDVRPSVSPRLSVSTLP